MTAQFDRIVAQMRRGGMTRREFVGRATAMGVSTALASAIFAKGARAEEAKKGGVIRVGMSGGESTNSLDPALAASEVPFQVNMTWGEMLTDVKPDGTLDMRIAEEVSSTPDASEWKFKIRKGVEYHNGATVTAEDVVATLKRHTDEKSQSGALGVVKGISEMKAEGDMVTLKLGAANADLPYLMGDYHLMIQPGGGVDNPAAGIGAGPYMIDVNEPGVRHTFKKNPNYFDSGMGHVYTSAGDQDARILVVCFGQNLPEISQADPTPDRRDELREGRQDRL